MGDEPQVTDEMLDEAAKEGEDISKPDEPDKPDDTPDDIPDEPDDPAERSKLGRKVKEMAEKQDEFFESMKALLQTRLEEKETEPKDDELDFFDGIPQSKEELDKWYESKKAQERKAKETYEKAYLAQLEMEKGNTKDKEIHQEIMTELMENYNIKHSENGSQDAKINYLSAKASYLEKAVTAKKNPHDKNKGKKVENLGESSSTSVDDTKSSKTIKLDSYAQDFVNRTNMSEEKVQEALSGDMPTYLGGHR